MKSLNILLSAGEHSSPKEVREQRFAMTLSLATGFLMLAGKTYAYFITGSSAILSDAAESIVHVFAVGFATYSLWLSQKPADTSLPYGHDKISYFSAGMEGGLIVIAALFIIYAAVAEWLSGLALENLSTGTYYVAGAAIINTVLGSFLIWKGKKTGSIILVANGKHVFTDVWTSFGVVIGLILVMVTGWLPFDPIVAILAACNILYSGGQLIRQSVGGLMDEGDPELGASLARALEEETGARGVGYHRLRYRTSGTSLWVDVHLLFEDGITLESAHAKATEIEAAMLKRLPVSLYFTSHLEPASLHDDDHERAEVPHR
jgi:cation diffusion facilitator family transporter